MKTMTLNDYGIQKGLVESSKKIDIGCVMKAYRASVKQNAKKGAVEVNGVVITFTVSRTGNGGERLWFKCPLCERRIGTIYQSSFGQVGCRVCLKLDYRSHRYRGMVESNLGSVGR